MFLPIGDDQDHDRPPWVTRVLLAANIGTFLLACLPRPAAATIEAWALNPADPRPAQWFTHLFLHGDAIHLLGNLLFLWIFGRLVEERLGAPGFAGLYLASGLAAAALHLVVIPGPARLLGSSGAISGALGACLVFCPRAHVKVLYWIFITAGTAFVPITLWGLLWVVEQVFFASQGMGGVAYWAHLGGFAAGFAIAWTIREVAARRIRAREAPLERREGRRPFAATPSDDEAFLDDAIDAYAVVYLDAPPPGAPPSGVAARALPRAEAEARRTALASPAALIADQAANHPGAPREVESAGWDDRLIRLRAGADVIPLPWTSIALAVEAELDGATFLDLFASRTVAYRVQAKPGVLLTRIDPARRSEEPGTLGGLAQALEERRGVPCAVGRFPDAATYADYVFRAWHLARAGRAVHRVR